MKKLENLIDNNERKAYKECFPRLLSLQRVSEKDINPINTKHWKTPSKLHYHRPTAPDLLLEERGESNFKSFSAKNIYEWNIDA